MARRKKFNLTDDEARDLAKVLPGKTKALAIHALCEKVISLLDAANKPARRKYMRGYMRDYRKRKSADIQDSQEPGPTPQGQGAEDTPSRGVGGFGPKTFNF